MERQVHTDVTRSETKEETKSERDDRNKSV